MCGVKLIGNGLSIHLDEFTFQGPSANYFTPEAPFCQFGGLFYEVMFLQSQFETLSMSRCEDAQRGQLMLVGNGVLILYVLYFAGYSQGTASIRIQGGQNIFVGQEQHCTSHFNDCVVKYRVWEGLYTEIHDGAVESDDWKAFQIFTPLPAYKRAYRIADTPIVLHITAGSLSYPFVLGTVQMHIELASTNTTMAVTCAHRIHVGVVTTEEGTFSPIWHRKSLESILSINMERLFPLVVYMSITAQICPLIENPNHVILRIQLKKHKVCGVVEFSLWSSQIAGDCRHLTLPYPLSNASFYTDIVHVYTVSMNPACQYKMCLDINISAALSTSTNQCDVQWKHVNLATTSLKIVFPGKITITWKRKPLCAEVPSEVINRCHLEINISIHTLPDYIQSRFSVDHSANLTTIQMGNLKEYILPRR